MNLFPKKKSVRQKTPSSVPLLGDRRDDRVSWLKSVKLFEGIQTNAQAMEYIDGIMVLRQYEAGQEILCEGEKGQEAFFLKQGRVRVQKSISGGESFPVAILEAINQPFFGEAALLEAEHRTATILAETFCHCLILSKENFDQLIAKHPQWALPLVLNISRALMSRLHQANNDVVLLYRALVREVRGDVG